MVDVYNNFTAPYIPPIDPSNASDTQNFDDAFLDMEPVIDNEPEQTDSDRGGERTDTDKTDGEDSVRTPAQSRSPSAHPPEEEDGPDLFDGYSFKGRHSVLIDDEEEGEVEDDDKVDEEVDEIDDAVTQASAEVPSKNIDDETPTPEPEASEPRTPEPRGSILLDEGVITPVASEPAVAELKDNDDNEVIVPEVPPKVFEIAPSPDAASADRFSKTEADLPPLPQTPERKTVEISPTHTELPQLPVQSRLAPPARLPARGRREKSGIHALDKYLSDGGDDGDGDITEREEDDDWDFVEAPGVGFEDRNGNKGTSLFARGVVDRYRLAVFRKASTPSKNSTPRNVSGVSSTSEVNGGGVSETPSPGEKQRRGRNPPLSFRRNPKTFLRARSPPPPPSSFSSRSNGGKALARSLSASSAGMITPSLSTNSSTVGPSLKSKESTTSVGSPSSDDQSVNGDALNGAPNGPSTPEASKRPSRSSLADEPEKTKTKKLKKYKEGAEKMLSLFASPRQ